MRQICRKYAVFMCNIKKIDWKIVQIEYKQWNITEFENDDNNKFVKKRLTKKLKKFDFFDDDDEKKID